VSEELTAPCAGALGTALYAYEKSAAIRRLADMETKLTGNRRI